MNIGCLSSLSFLPVFWQMQSHSICPPNLLLPILAFPGLSQNDREKAKVKFPEN